MATPGSSGVVYKMVAVVLRWSCFSEEVSYS